MAQTFFKCFITSYLTDKLSSNEHLSQAQRSRASLIIDRIKGLFVADSSDRIGNTDSDFLIKINKIFANEYHAESIFVGRRLDQNKNLQDLLQVLMTLTGNEVALPDDDLQLASVLHIFEQLSLVDRDISKVLALEDGVQYPDDIYKELFKLTCAKVVVEHKIDTWFKLHYSPVSSRLKIDPVHAEINSTFLICLFKELEDINADALIEYFKQAKDLIRIYSGDITDARQQRFSTWAIDKLTPFLSEELVDAARTYVFSFGSFSQESLQWLTKKFILIFEREKLILIKIKPLLELPISTLMSREHSLLNGQVRPVITSARDGGSINPERSYKNFVVVPDSERGNGSDSDELSLSDVEGCSGFYAVAAAAASSESCVRRPLITDRQDGPYKLRSRSVPSSIIPKPGEDRTIIRRSKSCSK